MKYELMIVRKSEPNEEGRWITVEYAGYVDALVQWCHLERLIPEDHFIVQVKRVVRHT